MTTEMAKYRIRQKTQACHDPNRRHTTKCRGGEIGETVRND